MFDRAVGVFELVEPCLDIVSVLISGLVVTAKSLFPSLGDLGEI